MIEQTNKHHDVGTGNITGRQNSGKGHRGVKAIDQDLLIDRSIDRIGPTTSNTIDLLTVRV